MRRSISIGSVMLTVGMVVLAIASAQPPQTPVQTPQAPPSLSPAMPMPPADPAKLAEPAGAKSPGPPVDAAYVLGPEDQITLTMWDEPKFDGAYTISPDGKISVKLIGEIQAAGKTVPELQEAINKAARSMLTTPRATVNVTAVNSKHIYFDGEGIKNPGSMPLVIPVHLLEAISSRGGFTDFANKNKITILRDGKKLLINRGGKKTEFFRYSDMTSGKHPESNPLLQDNDHVIVP